MKARPDDRDLKELGDVPWRLALVQRDLVWDDVRMARLLDSMLAGYPIGTLLVCRVGQPSFRIRHPRVDRSDQARLDEDADAPDRGGS
jgi:hypothetical protein